MTSLARTLQAVRPHIPRIKFPSRVLDGSTGTAGSMLQPVTRRPSDPIASTLSGLEETLPLRFQRMPISLVEMEYIERGGPE